MFEDYTKLFCLHFYLVSSELMNIEIDESLLQNLRNKFPNYYDFSTYGGSFLLKNRKTFDPNDFFNGELIMRDANFFSFFKGGFGSVEGDSLGRRWSDGEESELVIPLESQFSYELELTAMPYKYQNEKQSISICINGNYIGLIKLESFDYHSYKILIPKIYVQDTNTIIFKYAYFISPNEVNKENMDFRKLGVNFNKFKFTKIL